MVRRIADLRKKHRERFLLDQFLQSAGIVVEDILQREAPDFGGSIDGRPLGIEITGLYVESSPKRAPRQAQEAIAQRIAQRAREVYEKRASIPMHVQLYFNSAFDLTSVNRDAIAARLADLVSGLRLQEWERFTWHQDGQGRLPAALSYVSTVRVPEPRLGHWAVASAGWVAPLSTTSLQAAINDKATLLPTYRAAFPEVWLLVVADATRPSGLLEVRDDFCRGSIVSPFDRTFFYAHPNRVILEFTSGR